MGTADRFSAAELEVLTGHGIVLFADRVIFDAQPPMPATRMAEVERQCRGPLPPGLRELWSTTAGGALDYDVSVELPGPGRRHQLALSWTTLFFHGNDGYNDLPGWIAHELELAADAAEETGADPADVRLAAVPIGGFEYTDRVYVRVDPEQAGEVIAWVHGLPPAWRHRLHADTVVVLGEDVRAAFAALRLDEDPLAPTGSYYAGQDLLAFVEQCRAGGLDLELADRVVAYYRRAVLDWRTPLERGTLGADPVRAGVAVRHALATDDAALVDRLAAAGVDLEAPVGGDATPVEDALTRGAWSALAALIEAGVQVGADALTSLDGPIPVDLTRALLQRGARATGAAVVAAVVHGAPASADLLAAAVRRDSADDRASEADSAGPDAVVAARASALAELEQTLADVRAGRLGHYLGEAGLAERLARLRAYDPRPH